ncbi:MAG: hypothetical protein JF600_17760 [Xanthomonadales bacterium]|nr:hypothetical protein [Xanthomonadales bacterium]
MTIYAVQYALRPAPHSEDFATVGGAIVHSLVRADTPEAAHAAAMAYFRDDGWELVAVEHQPSPVARAQCEDDPEFLDAWDEAEAHGECHLFHLWPPGGEDDAPLH